MLQLLYKTPNLPCIAATQTNIEEQGVTVINLATTCKDIEVIKCRHMQDHYKYLCKLTPELWCLLVYDSTDENLIYENIYFSYRDALYAYNHFNKEEVE